MGPISANHIQLIDLFGLDKVQDFVQIKTTPRTSKDSSSFVVNVVHEFGSQNERLQVWVVKSSKSTLDAVHFSSNGVRLVQGFGNFSNHIVQPRAESSARYNGRVDVFGIEMQETTCPRAHKGHSVRVHIGFSHNIGNDAFMIGNKFIVRRRTVRMTAFFIAVRHGGLLTHYGRSDAALGHADRLVVHHIFDQGGWVLLAQVF
mmetsp:Transcript_21683/g.49985  ORF Transcript_21683/g.49985 Transcript_21683/m.49985 type:complete len:203 (-) Transcript_21683:412-1020(-)